MEYVSLAREDNHIRLYHIQTNGAFYWFIGYLIFITVILIIGEKVLRITLVDTLPLKLLLL